MTESTVENVKPREPVATIGPGARLREAREARKLTVEAAATQLRIDPALVLALEEDDYDKFAAPIFITGNIRAYARLLDLAPEPLLEAYHGLGHDVPPALKQVNRYPRLGSSTSWAPGVIVLLLVVVAIMVFLGWQSGGRLPSFSQVQEPPVHDQNKTPPVPGAPESALLQGGGETGSGVIPSEDVDLGREEEPAAVPPPGLPTLPPVESPSAATSAPAVRATLSLKIDQASWVEVRDTTGRRLLYDLLDSGAMKTLEGVPPFDVLLGFAPGVTLEFNGKPVDQRLYARQDTARFRLGENGISSL